MKGKCNWDLLMLPIVWNFVTESQALLSNICHLTNNRHCIFLCKQCSFSLLPFNIYVFLWDIRQMYRFIYKMFKIYMKYLTILIYHLTITSFLLFDRLINLHGNKKCNNRMVFFNIKCLISISDPSIWSLI